MADLGGTIGYNVLATTSCAGLHAKRAPSGRKLRSTYPAERLNKEVERHLDVARILPNDAPITRLIGIALFDQNNKGHSANRYMIAQASSKIEAGETAIIPTLST